MNGYSDELYHYGVLGMKWGVHRSKKNAQKAKNRRDSAEEWEEIARDAKSKGKTKQANKYKRHAENDRTAAKKYEAKAAKIRTKHERRTDKATVSRVEKMSTGKAVAQSMIFGTYGALKYNQARASNLTKGKSVVYGLGGMAVSVLTSGIAPVVAPRINERTWKK